MPGVNGPSWPAGPRVRVRVDGALPPTSPGSCSTTLYVLVTVWGLPAVSWAVTVKLPGPATDVSRVAPLASVPTQSATATSSVHANETLTTWPFTNVAPCAGVAIVTVGAVVSGSVACAPAAGGSAAHSASTPSTPIHGLIMLLPSRGKPWNPAVTMKPPPGSVNFRSSKPDERLTGWWWTG